MARQRGLGKGLASLIPTANAATESALRKEAQNPDIFMPCDKLHPNPFQPRRKRKEDALDALVISIREHGVMQPILVRPHPEDGYQIVAGERRWRAAQAADIKEVPVRIMEISDEQSMELALVENLQREDLSAIETAQGIQDLVSKMSLTHEQVAQKIGLSRTAVTNKLRLLQLPEGIITMLEEEALTEGHARALLSLQDTEKMLDLAWMTVDRELNVRQLEQMVKGLSTEKRATTVVYPAKQQETLDFQGKIEKLMQRHPIKIHVAQSRKGLGLSIKGLKKQQVQLLLEYMEQQSGELFSET